MWNPVCCLKKARTFQTVRKCSFCQTFPSLFSSLKIFFFVVRFLVTIAPGGLSARHSTGLVPWKSLQNLLLFFSFSGGCLGDCLHPRSWCASVRPLGRPGQVLLVYGRQVPRYVLLVHTLSMKSTVLGWPRNIRPLEKVFRGYQADPLRKSLPWGVCG